MTKQPKLTPAQIQTLLLMRSGYPFILRADGKKAEHKRSRRVAPSVPVLFRHGLVKFASVDHKETGKYYTVALSHAGLLVATCEAAKYGR